MYPLGLILENYRSGCPPPQTHTHTHTHTEGTMQFEEIEELINFPLEHKVCVGTCILVLD